jgi:hypothetical protein
LDEAAKNYSKQLLFRNILSEITAEINNGGNEREKVKVNLD